MWRVRVGLGFLGYFVALIGAALHAQHVSAKMRAACAQAICADASAADHVVMDDGPEQDEPTRPPPMPVGRGGFLNDMPQYPDWTPQSTHMRSRPLPLVIEELARQSAVEQIPDLTASQG